VVVAGGRATPKSVKLADRSRYGPSVYEVRRCNHPKARRLHCPGANCFRGLMLIIADVFDISRTQAGWIELMIVGILGFAWLRLRRR